MADSSYMRYSFLGGERSKSAQGRADLPDYTTALNSCLNSFPIETGAWTRRPGFRHLTPTRGGAAGRVIPFDFKQRFPYVLEFTDGFLRFFSGSGIATPNDDKTILSISPANRAKVQTTVNHGLSTGNQTIFKSLGAACPLLQNRTFKITVTSVT